uniref:Hint domain-containing protein n=1 Tax=Aureoumbra lagunensis TaxID=44058 RepID=A0A7S3JX08_9STRA|mmetsp:Transcript_23897/g.28734  ORF Transcript_23897/g.28734 Transcript_23897/m.28734 type:complete len:339 (+) Transcript_23897:959-1975(+)
MAFLSLMLFTIGMVSAEMDLKVAHENGEKSNKSFINMTRALPSARAPAPVDNLTASVNKSMATKFKTASSVERISFCTTHSDCSQWYYCDRYYECWPCSYCFSNYDSITGYCPSSQDCCDSDSDCSSNEYCLLNTCFEDDDKDTQKKTQAKYCFPASGKVLTKQRGYVQISELVPLEEVAYLRNGNQLAFTPVLAKIPDLPEYSAEAYVKIETLRGISLVLTPNHYIIVNGKEVEASKVNLGDTVYTYEFGTDLIAKISMTNSTGLISPITLAGTLLVDGILVSSFGAPVSDSAKYNRLSSLLYTYIPSLFVNKMVTSTLGSQTFVDLYIYTSAFVSI